MAHFDKTVPYVSQNLTQTGGTDSTLTVASTNGFFTNQDCVLTGNGNSITLIVLDVESTTVLRMGQRVTTGQLGTNPSRINSGVDLSAYTVAGGAAITAAIQKKPGVDAGSIPYYVYEPDPIAANRVFLVDQQGNPANVSVSINMSDTISFVATGTNANFQYARVAASSITSSNSTQTTGFPFVTLARDTKQVILFNSLNQDCSLSFGGVETFRLEAGDSFTVDAASDGLKWASGTVITVFQNGTPPTTGSIRFTGQG